MPILYLVLAALISGCPAKRNCVAEFKSEYCLPKDFKKNENISDQFHEYKATRGIQLTWVRVPKKGEKLPSFAEQTNTEGKNIFEVTNVTNNGDISIQYLKTIKSAVGGAETIYLVHVNQLDSDNSEVAILGTSKEVVNEMLKHILN